jgi:predicted metal-dependent HD superfamily phosphohydrolase
VARLVLLTATHVTAPDDCDGHVLCDADLRILASSPERYSQYAADVRVEYSAVPDAAFASGRTSILTRLLDSDHLFATATARERWEPRARANIADEVARLTAGRR